MHQYECRSLKSTETMCSSLKEGNVMMLFTRDVLMTWLCYGVMALFTEIYKQCKPRKSSVTVLPIEGLALEEEEEEANRKLMTDLIMSSRGTEQKVREGLGNY